MKRNFWLAALVGVALTGCVNEEVVSVENQKEQMTFASVMKTQSRANVLGEIDDTAYPTQEDFKVYSWRYQNNFAGWTSSSPTPYFSVDGDVARHGYSTTGESKYWTTDVVHYWPDAQYKLILPPVTDLSDEEIKEAQKEGREEGDRKKKSCKRF